MQSHYNYVFDNLTSTYNFATKNNILYRVAFVVDETFSAISGEQIPNIFQIVIEKANDGLEPFDSVVSKTVESIIERFFQNEENSLVYICSEENNKAKARHLIFNRWYQNSRLQDVIVKIDNLININVDEFKIQTVYTSFMFHKQNPHYKRLIEVYYQIEKVLNEEK